MSVDHAILTFIKTKTNLSEKSITNTIQLFDEGASIPFISRYRKEMTGSLNEVQVEAIQQYYSTIKDLISRKEYIINIIKEQGELNPKLQQSIQQCWDPILLEDLYLPYKRKKKTRGTIAKNNGLEPLANLIFWSKTRDIERSAQQFITPQVTRIEDALAGARDIIAENISEHKVAREITRDIFKRTATFDSKVIKSKEKEAEKYKNYFSFNQSLSRVPSHRLLAIYRGEEEKYLRVKIEIDMP